MNGKQAKRIRREAKNFSSPEMMENKYVKTNEKSRVVPFMKPRQIVIGHKEEPVLDENGVQLLDENGEPKTQSQPITVNAPHRSGNPFTSNGGVMQVAQVDSCTQELDMCFRKLYQGIKENYLQVVRG